MQFTALGHKSTQPSKNLETFEKPTGVTQVTMASDELTSMCPVTGQPDFSQVEIEYEPDRLCIESKSLKLYFWSFRDEGIFCEALASRIAHDVMQAAQPFRCRVTIRQSVRGGITIKAVADLTRDQHESR